MALKKGFLYQLSLLLVPPLYRLLTGLLFATCRLERHGYEHYRNCISSGKPFIIAFWHYGLFYIISRSEGIEYVAMVSPSKDGEYISRTLNSMGVETVRGSKKGGGIAALKSLMRSMKEGKTAALVADGSQGPARKAQPGSILLASRTGAPIICGAWGASRYRAFKSWDRTALPMPFAKISMWYGEPLHVPKKLDSEGLEKYRLILENRLNEQYHKAWAEFGVEEH